MNRLFFGLAAACALACSAVLVTSSCGQDREPGARESITALPDFEDALSEELMLALHQAKNFHHIADVYVQSGKLAKASDAVRKILSIPFPKDAPESEDVLLDARARLAKMLVTQGQLDQAMKIVDQGIAPAKRESFFLSNLYTVKGEVHEARAVGLDESDAAAATSEREKAIAARMRSIDIDTTLQKRLMGKTR
jgi:predicted negative regulator of RcsB-dependent stress response